MKSSLLLFLKGVAMGAANVAPGVSGAVAFVAGIYDELLREHVHTGLAMCLRPCC
ncbi:undecaprenyl phosphate translocase family protein [Azorhizophilus paspali]|uniref:undecaprenyl phosphate translocase family protein n=1 Tax=Azorhizophilus paspali TaxID=69963 RepID=UPI00362505CB